MHSTLVPAAGTNSAGLVRAGEHRTVVRLPCILNLILRPDWLFSKISFPLIPSPDCDSGMGGETSMHAPVMVRIPPVSPRWTVLRCRLEAEHELGGTCDADSRSFGASGLRGLRGIRCTDGAESDWT